MSEILSSFQLSPGEPAPDFSLPDADGRVVTRAEVAGQRGLLVVFACNHCPFVVHLADALGEFAREIAPQGVNTVAINSNDLERYPQDGPEPMKVFAADAALGFSLLLDESQEIAKAHGAVCTPDFFLFDADGKLVLCRSIRRFPAAQRNRAPRRRPSRSGAPDAGRRSPARPALPEQRLQHQVEAGQRAGRLNSKP